MKLSNDPTLLRLLTEAVDEKAERLERESVAHPDDQAVKDDLMGVWALQAKLFRDDGLGGIP